MSDPIRIGAVAYLNTLPLVHGMEQGLGRDRIELSYDVPAVLADRMRAEELDLALMPIVELAGIPDLEVVPGLGIVTRGPSRSVLLIANRPAEQVATVALDPESRTSNALIQLLFHECLPGERRFEIGPIGLAEGLANYDAMLRIGDKALFEEPPAGSHVYDLGEMWTAHTGLPFLFAAWVVRQGRLDRKTYRLLHDSRRAGSKAIDEIAAAYRFRGQAHPERARAYLDEAIHYRLGERELRAIRLFFELAARHGVIETVPQVRLALAGGTACHELAGTALPSERGLP